jgi:hypothetical protein
MGRVTLRAKPDEGRVVGKPSLLREVGEAFNGPALDIVEPSLRREIRRRLAKTPRAHKFDPSGKERTPAGSPGAQEIGGSKTERDTRVRVVQDKASGAGGGRGARGATYAVEATSLTKSHDKAVHTFGILVGGRKKGVGQTMDSPMSFWGRRGNEGRIRVRPVGRSRRWRKGVVPFIRFGGIREDKDFVTRVFDERTLGRLSRAFERAVVKVLSGDRLKDYTGEWEAVVDVE